MELFKTLNLHTIALNRGSKNVVPNLIVLGDFNLDAGMQFNTNYSRKNVFNELNPLINDLKLNL